MSAARADYASSILSPHAVSASGRAAYLVSSHGQMLVSDARYLLITLAAAPRAPRRYVERPPILASRCRFLKCLLVSIRRTTCRHDITFAYFLYLAKARRSDVLMRGTYRY